MLVSFNGQANGRQGGTIEGSPLFVLSEVQISTNREVSLLFCCF
ncbi:hypothetical protein PORCRE_1373 [Porphyromonas crevioricanis JCM 15906]|uniref:Uncharacterized protein n=1 Tax=Porphyromonas crevioricanis JCM 15906 TaxID=1305617 RepID=T1CRG1_9PORP|nr:hypothetical protein PORCRE_1373 [Porphyromonas crevioricanis JCM 15906]GAD06554.1 hypothetical protein PORCAN_150 [Porphyromonas crevioricanis JCM 13913]